jgi:preprotein translocase subunit SecG
MSTLLTPILLAIHIMLAIALIGVVLLQRSEGGLGGLGGGMSGFMTTRGSANLLTKTTRWLAGTFMATSLVLAWLAAHESAPRPVISSQPPPVEAPAPAVPTQDQGGAATTAPSASQPAQSGTGATTAPVEPTVPTNQ